MNNNTQVAKSPLNAVLWILAIALVIAGVYGNSYFGGESLLYRVLGMLVVAIAAAMVAFQTVQGKAFWVLLKGARTEIRKVVWPTRQETSANHHDCFIGCYCCWSFIMGLGHIAWLVSVTCYWLIAGIVGGNDFYKQFLYTK